MSALTRPSFGTIVRAFLLALPALALPIVIRTAVVEGVATATEVSTVGVIPLSHTFDHVGPLTQSVADACLVYHALLGDPGAVPPAPRPLTGLRLAVLRKYFCDLLDDDVRARFEEAVARLRAAGAHIDDIEILRPEEIAPGLMSLCKPS